MTALLATPAAMIALALLIEAAVGYPTGLYARVRHPVVWIGALVTVLERRGNDLSWPAWVRRLSGCVGVLVVVGVAGGVGWCLAWPAWTWWPLVEALLASSLLAQRSLHEHVHAVARPLGEGRLAAAREALAQVVGRDVTVLDESAVARAGIETLAENTSDGVVAPAFWGALFGLPGLAAYKAINTLDSMIGHRSPRHEAFGWAAARLDDLVNLVPARLTALILALGAGRQARTAAATAWRDAHRHRSPNAGWPEAAMAGALGVRLSGPRLYGDQIAPEPWLNAAAPDPRPGDMGKALGLYRRSCALLFILVVALAFVERGL